MKKGCWEDKEVQDLFSAVEQIKQKSRPLKEAFVAHAQKYSRKPNSVRNYYYFQLAGLQEDADKTKRLGINLKLHEKNEIEYFSPQQQENLVKQIDNLVKDGNSIRRACYTLSGGDINLMLRYQNKYHNTIKKEVSPQLPDNIVKFKRKPSLSEQDINSLFLGLVRLVKRCAIEEYDNKNKLLQQNASQQLRKALVDLNKREKEIEKLKAEFTKLKQQNIKLVQNLMQLKIEKAENLTQNKV